MAYSLDKRFPPPQKTYNIFDPGAYQNVNFTPVKPNKVPFLQKSARNSFGTKIYSEAIYNIEKERKIVPNCTSLLSKCPRFPYELLGTEIDKEILCQCGNEKPCQCADDSADEDVNEVLCQAKVPRTIFKGTVPRSTSGAPSKEDQVLPEKNEEESPPFYDARVLESTAFYQGCKWSKWTSKRSQNLLEKRPGPADYTIDNIPSYATLCAEKVRAFKRKTSKQYRFIEMVQRRNIMEGRPGPASYTPNFPKGTDLKSLGPKADRFVFSMYDIKPAPNEYHIKRVFDKNEPPLKQCRAKLPPPAFFGVKAARFKPQHEVGPSPASYNACYKPCLSENCNIAPFGSSSKRFKENLENEEGSDEDISLEDADETVESNCPKQHSTWEFRSKTIRLKPLLKKPDEPSPADLPMRNVIIKRSRQFQYNCPFFSSEGRFQPWFNWIPVYGKEKLPGPAYYCLDKPKCLPAVNCGPLYRSQRFSKGEFQTPAPNSYKIKSGIDDILATHNEKLKNNILNKHKFHWTPPKDPIKLSLYQQESILLDKSIALLDVADIFDPKKPVIKKSVSPRPSGKEPKLLRCFVQTQHMKTYF